MTNQNPTPQRPKNGDDNRDARTPRPRNYTGVILMVIIVVVCAIVLVNDVNRPEEATFTEVMEHLLRGNVDRVEVEKNQIEVALIKEKEGSKSKKVRLTVPDKFISEHAIMLEEIAELGKRSQKTVGDEILRYLWNVVDQTKKTPTAADDVSRGFVVLKRYIIANVSREVGGDDGRAKSGEGSSAGRTDMLLVQMTVPDLGADAPRKRSSGLEPGSVATFLFKPCRFSDGANGQHELSWKDLMTATATEKENAAAGYAPVATVTKALPLDKGSLKFADDNTLIENLLISVAPWMLLLLFFWFIFFRQLRSNGIGGNVLSFGRSRARVANREKSAVTFADVAGIDEAKDEVGEVVEFLKHPQRFTRLGARIPRGILLVGSPGTGKTLLAKAIAGEADVPFFSICGSDFVEMFVGVGASRVRDLFKQARENSPCIIFLDEIDAVGRRRGAGLGGGHDEREQTLNAILVEMDGFDTDTGIIVIAATNRVDVLDPALLRPGRFDREIAVDLPDVKGREAILKVHAGRIKMHPSVELDRIARATPGFSGAELEAIVNESAIIAVMRKKDSVFMEDMEEARDRVKWGRAKTSRIMDQDDQRVTAYHEAGHTLISYLLAPKSHPPHKVTIIPRGRALGATMMLPEKDEYNFTIEQAEAQLQTAYGGRVAEELVFKMVSAGAANDIKQATLIARHMVREWGMSPTIGPIHLSDDDEPVFLGRDIGRRAQLSDSTFETVDREVKRIIDTNYAAARKLVQDNFDKLTTLAENLLRYEVLTKEEIEGLMQGQTVEAVRRRLVENQKALDPTPKEPTVVPPLPTAGLKSPGLAGGSAFFRMDDRFGEPSLSS